MTRLSDEEIDNMIAKRYPHRKLYDNYSEDELITFASEVVKSAESIYIPQIEKLQGENEGLKKTIDIANDVLWKDSKEIAQLTAKHERLVKVAESIAAIAHHGGLLGFITETKAMTEIRKITLPYWDKDEADRLQQEAIKKLTEEGNV